MHLDLHVLQIIALACTGGLGGVLLLLLIRTLLLLNVFLQLQAQAIAMRSYEAIVRAAVDYAEEWAHAESSIRKVFGEDKLHRALEFASQLKNDIPHLKLAIHAELGRRRMLRSTVTAAAILRPPPPPPQAPRPPR